MKIGSHVSIPDVVIFPGRRNPYEWENGIVIDTGKNKHGDKLVKVRVWRHFQNTTYEKGING